MFLEREDYDKTDKGAKTVRVKKEKNKAWLTNIILIVPIY